MNYTYRDTPCTHRICVLYTGLIQTRVYTQYINRQLLIKNEVICIFTDIQVSQHIVSIQMTLGGIFITRPKVIKSIKSPPKKKACGQIPFLNFSDPVLHITDAGAQRG